MNIKVIPKTLHPKVIEESFLILKGLRVQEKKIKMLTIKIKTIYSTL